MRCAALLLLFAALPAAAAETFAVVAVGDPPAGPGSDLAEMTHQLREACRDRVGGVLGVAEMRSRLLGQTSSASLAELERAYAGVQAAFDDDEMEIAAKALRNILDELEKMPESAQAYAQWTRASIRLAYVLRILKRPAAAAALMERLIATEPRYVVDDVLYPPSVRNAFESVRRRTAARHKAQVLVTSGGRPASVFVNGRPMGAAPVTVLLPPGRYRIGGASGDLRVPSAWVDVEAGDRTVTLDFDLAQAVRVNAGPGLALAPSERPPALLRAGGWLRATRVLAATLVTDAAGPSLDGAIYDVAQGELVREGRVRLAAGAVPAAQLGALASFLLHGQPALGVTQVSPPPPAAAPEGKAPAALPGPLAPAAQSPPLVEPAPRPGGSPRRAWMRPAAYTAGAIAIGLAGVAVWQGISSHSSSSQADRMTGPNQTFPPGTDVARYNQLRADADAASRNMYIAAAGTAVFAAAAGALGYLSRDERTGLAVVRF
jgi:hypothetical protein